MKRGALTSLLAMGARGARGEEDGGSVHENDETLPYDPGEMLAGVDTHIRRAEELLAGSLPPDTVDYEPPGTPAN